MSLQTFLSRTIPADTADLGVFLIPLENKYRQIGERFDELLPDEHEFADLYKPTGRGAIPPLLLILVTLFQMIEEVPDRIAAEWVVMRLDWKYACHLPLRYLGFHFTDLYAFRGRLLAHEAERRVFDLIVGRLKSHGYLKTRGKMRTDSTHLLGLVEKLSQFELVHESVRVALETMTDVDRVWVEQSLPAAFREAYRERRSQYNWTDEQVREHLQQAGQDGFWLVGHIECTAPAVLRQLAEVEVLRTVLAQQFPAGPSEAPAAKRPTGQDVIESPHEPEVRYGVKRGHGWQGYKLQVTETCDADRPHLIVDIDVGPATGHDSPELPKIQERLEARDNLPGQQLLDQAYISGAHLAESAQKGIELVGPPPQDTHDRKGFQQSDFRVDEAAQRATCPAEQTSVLWREQHEPGAPGPTITIRFKGATCQACQFLGQCTKSRQGRTLELSPYRALLAQRRAEASTEEFRTQFKLRAGIEATISELVRGHGGRQARYRGTRKLRLQACFMAAGVNLKRMARWWTRPEGAEQAAGRRT
jgi:hypothetical protein